MPWDNLSNAGMGKLTLVLAALFAGTALYITFVEQLARLVLVNWPYTLTIIMPINNRLNAIALEATPPQPRELIQYWGKLHAIRRLFGVCAILAYIVLL